MHDCMKYEWSRMHGHHAQEGAVGILLWPQAVYGQMRRAGRIITENKSRVMRGDDQIFAGIDDLDAQVFLPVRQREPQCIKSNCATNRSIPTRSVQDAP